MKIYKLIIALFSIAFFSTSCNKDKAPLVKREEVSFTISGNQQFQYDVGLFGPEEGVVISRQASHYSESRISRATQGNRITYFYTPATNYKGTDQVELKKLYSNGSNTYTDSAYVVINFNIQ